MRKTKILMAVMLLIVLLVPGCFGSITGSGNLKTQEFNYSDFTRVEVGNAFEVEVVQSDSFNITITADDNISDYINVSKSGDTLRIWLRSGYHYRNYTAIAEITMPELYRLELSGATSGTIVGFSSAHDFILELSGASSISINDMTAGNIRFDLSGASSLTGSITADGNARLDLSGASSVTLSGSANDLDADASGASHLGLDNFPVHNASIGLSGASGGTINLDGTLNADLSGDGFLNFIDFGIFAGQWRASNCREPDWCGGADFEPDGDVDFVDFAGFALRWMDTDCGVCGGADLISDGNVNWEDLLEFTENWLTGK